MNDLFVIVDKEYKEGTHKHMGVIYPKLENDAPVKARFFYPQKIDLEEVTAEEEPLCLTMEELVKAYMEALELLDFIDSQLAVDGRNTKQLCREMIKRHQMLHLPLPLYNE